MIKRLKNQFVHKPMILIFLLGICFIIVFLSGLVAGSLLTRHSNTFGAFWGTKRTDILISLLSIILGMIISIFLSYLPVYKETEIWTRRLYVELMDFRQDLSKYLAGKLSGQEFKTSFKIFKDIYSYGSNRYKFFIRKESNNLLKEIYRLIEKIILTPSYLKEVLIENDTEIYKCKIILDDIEKKYGHLFGENDS